MKTKFALPGCVLLVIAGILIGVFLRKDRTVTQLIGVPIRETATAQFAPPVASPVASPAASPVSGPTVAAPLLLPSGLNPAQTAVQAPPAPGVYVARDGDTLSDLAVHMLGTDTRANRQAIIDAEPSLQKNPDRVIAGQSYSLVKTEATPETLAIEKPASVQVPPQVAEAPTTPVLKYTATRGDTVTKLAGALLGDDSKESRDAIVNANPALKADPDHLVAGKSYRIVAPEGGLAAAAVPMEPATARPTTQPDADQLVKDDHRTLRYTAKAGDTVSRLAEALLGSDTPANRDAIINANATLRSNPDRVIEGKTYYIPAPAGEVTNAQ